MAYEDRIACPHCGYTSNAQGEDKGPQYVRGQACPQCFYIDYKALGKAKKV